MKRMSSGGLGQKGLSTLLMGSPLATLAVLWCLGIAGVCGARDGNRNPLPRVVSSSKATVTPLATGGANSGTFSVLSYGAKGDGVTDDTKAFWTTWEAACKAQGSTMVVPIGATCLVGPVTFSGPCLSRITVLVEGKIIAPTNAEAWGSGLLQWLDFSNIQGITVTGKGLIDGKGAVWWKPVSVSVSVSSTDESSLASMPTTIPTALRIADSQNVEVDSITIQNSPKMHLKFDNCNGVNVHDITITSPGDSPNTDGIHIQNTQGVTLSSSKIACGDDCVSIQTGSSNVVIDNINCGPGHGISIGGLGEDKSKACVSNVTVQNCYIHDTLTGVRLKTWQGGSGSVRLVKFTNIQMAAVNTAIDIDQYYCNNEQSNTCGNQTAAVIVSDIVFDNITGTYTDRPMSFACSDTSPCTGITLNNIRLTPLQNTQPKAAFCWQAYGTGTSLSCLKPDKFSRPVEARDAC
ncbi:polygalacturonase At1g48100-like [Malania oleifera]|uniref:polygalacturonase At1g48100-like n=1 Tax=Malania oleifera TaxID=397392 RepID=UPI0025AEC16B|nr:polygalacturonase At1g48100-like [Malania oleifera]